MEENKDALAGSCGQQTTVPHGPLLRRRFMRHDEAWLFEGVKFWGLGGTGSSSLRGSSLAAGHGPLAVPASLVAERGLRAHGLQSLASRALEHRLSSCGSGAWLLHGN